MRPFRRLILASSFILVTSLVLATSAFAQQTPTATEKDSGGIGIGALAMATFPSFSNVPDGFDAKNGYGFGLWVGGNRNGVVGFTGEFIYLFKEEQYAGITAKHQALQIPALFHINFGSRQKNKPMGYGIIGPVFTINVKDEVTGGLSGNNFQSANVGMAFGAGFEVARIAIEARYNHDYKTISTGDNVIWANTKERRVELLAKVRFN